MGGWVGRISLVDGPLFVLSYALAVALVVVLVVPPRRARVPARRFVAFAVTGGVLGAVAGVGLAYLLDDVLDVFGVALTPVVRIGDALALAAWGIAVVSLVLGRGRRIPIALLSVALTGWCLFLTINVDFGQYRTLGALVGTEHSARLDLPERVDAVPLDDWTPPTDMPDDVVTGVVDIPAIAADFAPRSARVVLPPAALVDDPPALPVVVALSGQPGSPVDVLSSARMVSTVQRIADEHGGVAPIVVVPDQLGDPSENPMCVDSPGVESATYLTVDVTDWIERSLNVSADRLDWTIAGFSQGGTCSIQLGAEYPELFGSIVDISGEASPSLGNPDKTVRDGFGGDEESYLAATPGVILERAAPYDDSVAVFVVGERDRRYTGYLQDVAAAAEAAGMAVSTVVVPDSAHDWNTAADGFRAAFEALLPRWGIR